MENQTDEAIRRALEDLVRLRKQALLIDTAFRLGPENPGDHLVPEVGEALEEDLDESEARKRNEY